MSLIDEDAEPRPATERSDRDRHEPRHRKKPFPSRRVALIGFGAVVLGTAAGCAAFILKAEGGNKDLVDNLGVSALGLVFFVGLPCLMVPGIARISAALEKRKRLASALYRLGMLIIGYAIMISGLYLLSQGFVLRGVSTVLFAIVCLWYGALRGENPEV
jgi:hypothetical protein